MGNRITTAARRIARTYNSENHWGVMHFDGEGRYLGQVEVNTWVLAEDGRQVSHKHHLGSRYVIDAHDPRRSRLTYAEAQRIMDESDEYEEVFGA